ncbi:hypothetical protein IFM89_031802 [Coptis chinensis]|uniref:Peptidase S8/S53 domain-containing protein n=1 Tax=Coptis chinensis TaxID=261450 RepID=A0A835HQ27_9MAGN|nr:hypothetical protein IFM89_031802 [Coptis chinensis]
MDVKLKTSATMVLLKELHEELFHLLGLLCTKCVGKKNCLGHDILTAFDDAIADRVDILYVSIGSKDIDLDDYSESAIVVGAFHAMQHGILTSASAGNRGFLVITIQSGDRGY